MAPLHHLAVSIKGPTADKLTQLHAIRDRRLAEPQTSPYRMVDVCYLIPESLEGMNLQTVGYHRGCYQRFTKNLDRLSDTLNTSTEASMSRSPRKLPSSAGPLFPPQCIFCGKLEKKVSGKTQERIKFPSWKNKPATWKEVEPRALALGNTRLYCTAVSPGEGQGSVVDTLYQTLHNIY